MSRTKPKTRAKPAADQVEEFGITADQRRYVDQVILASRAIPNVPIDCGFAREDGCGGAELILIEERRGAPAGAVESMLVIHYDMMDFLARSRANETFRQELERVLVEHEQRAGIGDLTRHAEERFHALCACDPGAFAMFPSQQLSVEAMNENMVRVGLRAALVFLGLDPAVRHHAVTMNLPAAPLRMMAAVSMSARALADLLASWDAVANAIAPTVPTEWQRSGG